MKRVIQFFRALFRKARALPALIASPDDNSVDKILSRAKGKLIEPAIGKIVTCEDGKERHVYTISYSMRYRQMAVVNEWAEEEKGGAFVHLLKLFSQLNGDAPPTALELKRFDDAVMKRGDQAARRLKRRGITSFFGRMKKTNNDN